MNKCALRAAIPTTACCRLLGCPAQSHATAPAESTSCTKAFAHSRNAASKSLSGWKQLGPALANRTCRSFFRLRATSGFFGTHNVCSSLSVPVGFTASRGSNRQSCDRDCNTRKEPADAEEHQDIVDFDGHGFSPFMVGRRSRKGGLLAIVCGRRS
jgi:hypothetical protein